MKQTLKKLYRLIPFKQPTFELLRKTFRLPHSVYKHLSFQGLICVPLNNGKSFKIHHYGFSQENHLFWAGIDNARHKGSLLTWQYLCEDHPRVVLDIGANTGLYSLIASAVSPSSDIHAFEPVERVFSKLKTNIETNSFTVRCCDVAISDKTGTAVIYDEPTEHTYSVTVNKNLYNSPTARETTIRTQRLDRYYEENSLPGIDLMKIDVETHEAEVLNGMGNLLAQFRPTILIEILNKTVAKQVGELIEGLDYVYFDVDEETASLNRVETLTPNQNFNFLICRGDVAERIEARLHKTPKTSPTGGPQHDS